MREKLRFLGMDVHAETIAAAIAEPGGEIRSLGTIPNRMESVSMSSLRLRAVQCQKEMVVSCPATTELTAHKFGVKLVSKATDWAGFAGYAVF